MLPRFRSQLRCALLACGVLSCAESSAGAVEARTPAAPASDTATVARIGVPQAILAATRGEIRLVDVRPAGQRALGHIRDDLGVPVDQIRARQSELPRDRKLVFYCSCHAEETALEAARVLIAAGYSRVAVLVGGYDAWRAAGGPFQMDAGWEEVFRVDAPPSGWGKLPVDTARCRYARDDRVAFRGAASARIGCTFDSTARGFSGLLQRIDARRCAGRTVMLSAMVRSEALRPGAFLWVGAEDADGKLIAMSRSAPDSIRSTQEWSPVEVAGGVPPGAARALIGLSLVGAGRMWIDEVRVVLLEQPGQPRVRLVVENPGFEE